MTAMSCRVASWCCRSFCSLSDFFHSWACKGREYSLRNCAVRERQCCDSTPSAGPRAQDCSFELINFSLHRYDSLQALFAGKPGDFDLDRVGDAL